MNKSKLIQFENNIAELFNNAKIKAPIHIYSNNEDNLIKIFEFARDAGVDVTWA